MNWEARALLLCNERRVLHAESPCGEKVDGSDKSVKVLMFEENVTCSKCRDSEQYRSEAKKNG